ncbi:hypothetical protein ACFPOB_26040 [Bosea eneae]|uniref:Helix-turn-helix domain-containing protein n=1 Tax=Bosea eneae TaxID=151454 RepID=A0ABW0IYE7_9HYPH
MTTSFTPGLPPQAAEGAYIGQDRRGGYWLLRWNRLGHWEALGWEPTLGEPMPTLSAFAGEQQGLIVGHIEITRSGAPAGSEGAAVLKGGTRPADRHSEGVRALGEIRLSERERKALAALCEVEGDFAFMSFASIARRSGLHAGDVRRSVRALARKGMAQFGKGLWCDDGRPAGSGYCATESGRLRIGASK